MVIATAESLAIEMPGRSTLEDLIDATKGDPFLTLGAPNMGHALIIIVPDGKEPAHLRFLNAGTVNGVQQEPDNHRLYMVHTRTLGDQQIWVELHPGVN